MVALVLAEAFLDKFGGDSMAQVAAALDHYRVELRALGRPEPERGGRES